MKKLLLLILLLGLVGCQVSSPKESESNSNENYASIYNNHLTNPPKVLIESKDKNGKLINSQKFNNYVFNSIKTNDKIILYGDNENILSYSKEDNNFSTMKTPLKCVHKIVTNGSDYAILDRYGDDKYRSKAILYNSKDKMIKSFEFCENEIYDIQMTNHEFIIFDSNSNCISYDLKKGNKISSSSYTNTSGKHSSLTDGNNVYYLTNSMIKDINNQISYSLPDEINNLLNSNTFIRKFCIINNNWYLILQHRDMTKSMIYQLRINNNQLEIKNKIIKNQDIKSIHQDSNGNFMISYINDDQTITITKVVHQTLKESSVEIIKSSNDEYEYAMTIKLR